MIRVADYIAQTLAAHGIRHVFLLTGGGAMHLNDAFGRNKSLEYIACHHEQACAMAAESYFRMSGRLAAVNVTTGPGGINAMTGVWGAWVDSLGMIVISGQVKWETTVRSTDLPLRQLGDQEVDIAKLVGPITKYAVMVTDPNSIRYHLERALHLATQGRPGPVWLDVPMNVQGAQIDPAALRAYDPAEDKPLFETTNLESTCADVLKRLAAAKRPAILAGTGVRVSGAHADFLRLIERLNIPVATAWNAHDLVADDVPVYAGRQGIIGDRAGNFAIQNADFLLVLGCRLSIRQVSYNWKAFARAAYKVVVDVDAAELKKPTVAPDLPVHADVRDFISTLLRMNPKPSPHHADYVQWCLERRRRYPTVLPEYWKSESVNPYCLIDSLFSKLPEEALVVCGDGTACVVAFQAAKLRRGQRLFHNSGAAAMGYDLPATVGACISMNKKRVICITGDGSIQLNLQELQTIVTHKLPIKIVLLNNRGYHSIRQTQHAYFPDNIVGCGEESGLGFPNFAKLADAYGLGYARIENHAQMSSALDTLLADDRATICEVMIDLHQQFAPKLASRRLPDGRMVSPPLEDLAPFLDRNELRDNMLIPMEEQ